MTWYKDIHDGELMGRFWEKTLLGGERYIENLFLKGLLKEGSVLDVGCGPGCHTAYLSRDHHIVGIDLSKYLITKAKEECKNKGNYENVDLVRAHMDYLPFQPGTFDNVINILSFGYLSDEENESVFSESVRVLKKYGRYVHQQYYYPPSERPLKWVEEHPKVPKGFFVTKRKRYNPKTKRVHIIETIEDTQSGDNVSFDFENRLYDIEELKKLHKQRGLKINSIFGSFEMEGFDDLEIKEFDKKKFGLMTLVSERT